MKSSKLEQLENLLLSEDGLLVSLRLGNGLDEEKVENICCVLKELQVEWEDYDFIPKKAVDIFIDFYPAMESSCGLYSEDEADKIIDKADKIMDLIRDCIIQKNA